MPDLAEVPLHRAAKLAAGCLDPPPGKSRIALALAYGTLTHLAFLTGVAAMMLAMFFGLSRSWGTVPWPYSLLANLALIAQFPILHSALLSTWGRRVLAKVIPGPSGRTLATTTYALIASLQLLALFVLWTPSGTVWWRAQGWTLVLISTAYASAWLLLLKAILDAGIELQVGALGWMSLLQKIQVRFPDMPQGGLFRIIRQPIYVAFAATLWTVPVWTPDQLELAVFFTAYCIAAPRRKEARFVAIHGDRFRTYQARVPYMVPNLRPKSDRNPDDQSPQ
jgi:methanethiol S-methyltransferase